MTRYERIERTASGLRRLVKDHEVIPLFFVCFTHDFRLETEILGIPVHFLDCEMLIPYNETIGDPACPFMPVFKDEDCVKQYTSKSFFDGWEDWVAPKKDIYEYVIINGKRKLMKVHEGEKK